MAVNGYVKADIILTHGFFLCEDEKEQQVMRPHPPLGLMYLSAYLKQKNITVDLFDSTFATRTELDDKIRLAPGKVIGIYTNLMTRPSVLKIIRQAKRHNMTVILGGPESANYITEYLNHGADYVVSGEGEQTLHQLLQCLLDQGDVTNIDGVSYLNQQSLVMTNPARVLPADIDQYPWPDRAAVNIPKYLDAWLTQHGESCVSMITARGCPFKCTWCSHAVFGYSHRRRSPEDCADELADIVSQYNPTHVWYADDVFTIHYKWLYQYAEALEQRNLKVPFETISRADRMCNEKVMDTLEQMGCYRIWIGAESGSQRLLDDMQRRVTIEQIDQATKAAQKRGIQVGMFLMWGYGDEQIDDIDETVKQVARINPDIFLTTVAYPIKGTKFYQRHQEQIQISVQWQDGSDRNLILPQRRSDRYYRFADKYLNAHVAATRLQAKGELTSARLKAKHARLARQLLVAAKDEKYHVSS